MVRLGKVTIETRGLKDLLPEITGEPYNMI